MDRSVWRPWWVLVCWRLLALQFVLAPEHGPDGRDVLGHWLSSWLAVTILS
jgi:hypothetical protein